MSVMIAIPFLDGLLKKTTAPFYGSKQASDRQWACARIARQYQDGCLPGSASLRSRKRCARKARIPRLHPFLTTFSHSTNWTALRW
jgi:hypothetical protein